MQRRVARSAQLHSRVDLYSRASSSVSIQRLPMPVPRRARAFVAARAPAEERNVYSTSFPATSMSSIRSAISAGISGMGSWTAPTLGDQTMLTCNEGSSAG